MTRLLGRLGGWCAAHPLRVVAAWTLLAAFVVSMALAFGGSFSEQRSLPGTEIAAAEDLLAAHFPAADGDSADVLLHDAAAPRVAAAADRVGPRLARLRHVAAVSPV